MGFQDPLPKNSQKINNKEKEFQSRGQQDTGTSLALDIDSS